MSSDCTQFLKKLIITLIKQTFYQFTV